jgi:hypothetical protein
LRTEHSRLEIDVTVGGADYYPEEVRGYLNNTALGIELVVDVVGKDMSTSTLSSFVQYTRCRSPFPLTPRTALTISKPTLGSLVD